MLSNYSSSPTTDDIIFGSSSKPDEKRTDHGKKVQGNNVLPHLIGHSNSKKMLSDSKLNIKSEEAEEHNFTPTADIILGSSSKPDKKRTDHVEKFKGSNVLPHVIGHSNKKKMLSYSNLKIKSEEVEEHNFTPTADDIILGSSSKPDKKRTDHDEKVKAHHPSLMKREQIMVKRSRKDSSSDAVKDAAGFSLGKSDLNVGGNEEVRQYDSTAADKNKTLKSSLSTEGKGNVPKTYEPANAIVKGSSADASRHATGFKRRANDSDSEIGAFRQAGSGNPD
uniref:Uncharacterized protein n=1 Tax=Quercus lobata TaxID=97700 RepID=A0A7N2M212_QUELO